VLSEPLTAIEYFLLCQQCIENNGSQNYFRSACWIAALLDLLQEYINGGH